MSENSYQKSFHVEVDSIGQVNVPSDKYLGAQTQHAFQQAHKYATLLLLITHNPSCHCHDYGIIYHTTKD